MYYCFAYSFDMLIFPLVFNCYLFSSMYIDCILCRKCISVYKTHGAHGIFELCSVPVRFCQYLLQYAVMKVLCSCFVLNLAVHLSANMK